MPYQKIISKFWNNPKQVLDFAREKPSQYLKDFFIKIKNPKKKKVLDLGCGGGRNTEMLLHLGFDAFACDLHEEMVKFTKKRVRKIDKEASENIVIASMSSLPYSENFFDFVVSNGVFHNAGSLKEFEISIKESARVLKKNGFLIVNMFVKDNILNKEFKKRRGEKFLYFTKIGLPIILLPVYKLIGIFSKNNLKILSFREDLVMIKTGKRRVFKTVFQKIKENNDIPLFNLRALIDRSNKKIVCAFSNRFSLVKEVKKYKKRTGLPFIDCKREYEIDKELIKFSQNYKLGIDKKKLEKIIKFILRISK